CVVSLLHLHDCGCANLHRVSKMQCVIEHFRFCKKSGNDSCVLCNQVVTSCFHHAKDCTRNSCLV
ncbi:hypothetical protein Angca_010140, partial [Angiostrongylus cantonensis]